MTATIYTEVPGTTCVIDGQHGVVTELHSDVPAHGPSVAFVRLDGVVYAHDDPACAGTAPALVGVTLAVQLGDRVGARRELHEVRSWRVITRDDFDAIVGIDQLRRDLGWRP